MAFCIFMLHGDFAWPPTVDPERATGRATGVVEIHYERGEDGSYVALLRWRPAHAADGAAPVPAGNVFDGDDASALFESGADWEVCVWIDPRKKSKKNLGKRLVFRGAFLFTQIEHMAGDGLERSLLRWPLVPSCRYANAGIEVFSQLVVGQPGNGADQPSGNLRFDFHVPTPFEQTKISDWAAKAFPFSAIFRPVVDSLDEATNFTTLVGGPVGTDIENASFIFKPDTVPSRRLGSFGFAPTDSPFSLQFAQYRTNRHSTLFPPSVKPARYWSALYSGWADGGCIRVLRQMGLRLERDMSLDVEDLEDAGNAASMSLRLPGAVAPARRNEPDVWKLRYRVTLKVRDGTGQAGDITWRDGRLVLLLEEETGGYLATGSPRLQFDCEVSWTITDQALFTPAAWSPRARLLIHWPEDIAKGPLAAAPVLDAGPRRLPLFRSGMLAAAAQALYGSPRSLYQVEPSHPQSFLPQLVSPDKQRVRFVLYAPTVSLHREADGMIGWPSAGGARTPLRLSLASAGDLLQGDLAPGDGQLRLDATLSSYFTGAEQPEVKLLLGHRPGWEPVTWDAATAGEAYFAAFSIRKLTCEGGQGRISSLEFTSARFDRDEPGRLLAGGRGVGSHPLDPSRQPADYPFAFAALLELELSVRRVTALGPGTGRSDDERATPLLIPLNAGQLPDKDAFHLLVRESVAPLADRLLEVQLIEDTPDSDNMQLAYAVVSSEPFGIARFAHRPLAARGGSARSVVATYSSVDRFWRYTAQEHYHYWLPPQGIGESADKPRRLELHDWLDVAADDDPGAPVPAGGVPRPYRVRLGEADDSGNRKPVYDSLQRRAVEFRLTPSAEIWIQPSDVKRGYYMPEWQVHELFRQRGELGLGVALKAFRAEFLYGLPVGVDVTREKGPARRARVAEIEALTGRFLPTFPGQSGPELRWNVLRRALLQRPERLEAWAHDPDAVVEFAPARFSSGVQFALRQTALVRAPLSALDQSGRLPPEGEGVVPPTFRYHPQGLSGGALWPVESANLFRALAANPQSSGGTLEDVAFSPLGGDAVQKALFLGGKVSIISRTRNGFIESQRVEVIGRVGALWHRAKHVVVFERTVNSSAQFAPEFKEDPQRTRSRRPILRKVREYVEILQRERAYPDFTKVSARTTGFLERVRFNSTIINVDSAWSRDVADYGWEVPLWNRAAAVRRPQVYPMPDTAFCSHAEGEGETPTVAQECLDCDHLYFFADFQTPTADTDAWPERLGVDYVDMPAAATLAGIVDRRSSADPPDSGGAARRRRPVSRFLPGMRRFTWRLASASRKVAINAGRSASPLYVGLDSVTFMRATAVTGAEKVFEKTLGPVLDFSMRAATHAAPGTLYWPAGGGGDIDGLKAAFSTHVADVRKAARENGDVTVAAQALRTWLAANQAKLKEELDKEFEGPLTAAAKGVLGGIAAAPDYVRQGRSHCDRMRTDALGLIHGKAMLIESLVRDWEAGIEQFLPHASTKAELIKELADALVKQIRPAFDEAQDVVAHAGEDSQAARAILAEVRMEVHAAVAGMRARIDEHRKSYDDTKPWSENRLAQFEQGLFALAASLADDVSARIEEARQRLGMELDDLSQQMAGAVAVVLRRGDQSQSKALATVADYRTAIAAMLEMAVVKLDPTSFDKVLGSLAEARKKIAGNTTPGVPELDALIESARKAAGSLRQTALDGRARVTALAARLEKYDEAAVAGIRQTGTELSGMLENVEERAKDLEKASRRAADLAFADVAALIDGGRKEYGLWAEDVGEAAKRYAAVVGKPIDLAVGQLERVVTGALGTIEEGIALALKTLDGVAGEITEAMSAAERALAPGALLDTVVRSRVIVPVLEQLLAPLPEALGDGQLKDARLRLETVSASVGEGLRRLEVDSLSAVGEITALCSSVFDAADSVFDYAKKLEDGAQKYIHAQVDKARAALEEAFKEAAPGVEKVLAAVTATDQAVRRIQNDLSRSAESARAYGDRIMDAAGRLGSGGLLAAPGNILRLYSAVSSAPELAALKADIDRLRASFDELNDVIGTTRVTALFNRLGDELKALGLSMPFDGIGDRLLPADLSSLDIGRVFRNFGGAKLEDLFKGCRLPRGVSDAIVLTHEFNPAKGRAWVQIDINASLPGRRSLFSVQVFKADFVDTKLTAQVRFEVTQDAPEVTQTGFGRIDTVIDLAVAGQSMVRFEKFGLSFTREKGMQVEFDPKSIRINPSLRFVQDFLAMLFPDELGGMRVIKRDGIPVGLEHEFAMPPLSLNFGTSGISNICISNQFRLTAYPDFVLANQFWLSRPERPFIFSFFIIGGTGYVHVDAEYKPFGEGELVVTVEAAAGGSAALGFSFGPFSGQVFITLSVALSYQKRIGSPGGGLSIGAVLVIAGYVNVASIATVGICLMLRMTYRDSGQVDGTGTLSVTIRISRFFKITARANAQYRLRDGQAQTQSTVSTDLQTESELADGVRRLQKARG